MKFDMKWHNISSPNLYYAITRYGTKTFNIFTSVTVIIINNRLLFVLAPSINSFKKIIIFIGLKDFTSTYCKM